MLKKHQQREICVRSIDCQCGSCLVVCSKQRREAIDTSHLQNQRRELSSPKNRAEAFLKPRSELHGGSIFVGEINIIGPNEIGEISSKMNESKIFEGMTRGLVAEVSDKQHSMDICTIMERKDSVDALHIDRLTIATKPSCCQKLEKMKSLKTLSGCLGSDSKTKLTSSVHEPLNEKKHLDHLVHKAKLSADFWTTSTRDMENYSAAQSRGSISSISTSTQTPDAHGAANTNNHSEFVNHGFICWNQIRQQWVGLKIPEKQPKQLLEPKLSWNATYDSLLGSNKPFPKRIPLAEMVDFLVDVWEQEGMYD